MRLAEHYAAERKADWNMYFLLVRGMKDPPAPEKMFPLLQYDVDRMQMVVEGSEDDLASFQQVTAALMVR